MTTVKHWLYGEGKIIRSRYNNFEYLVDFGKRQRWVRHDEIEFNDTIKKKTHDKVKRRKYSEEKLEKRRIIEGLRLGIVIPDFVRKYTVGREYEFNQVMKWLNEPKSTKKNTPLWIIGQYGIGKTHFLEYIKYNVIKQNWAVSIISVERNEALHPLSVYQKILNNFIFMYEGIERNFIDFLKITYEKDKNAFSGHPYLEPIFKNKKYYDWKELYNIISGRKKIDKIDMPNLYDYYTCANIYVNIISAISWATKNVLNLNGFILIIDEFENFDRNISTYAYKMGNNLLEGLKLVSMNDKKLLKEVKDWNFYGENKWIGGYTDLIYCGRSQISYVWKIPSALKLIYAYATSEIDDVRSLILEKITDEAFIKIAEAIQQIYCDAYNISIDLKFDRIFPVYLINKTDNLRYFVKGVIEILDLVRYYSNKQIEELLG